MDVGQAISLSGQTKSLPYISNKALTNGRGIMEKADRLSGYRVLLKIRQKAYHRNVIIAGGGFLFAILSTTATLLLTEWNERSIWLMGIFDVLFVVNFLMAWTKLEITKEKIELVNNLQIQD
jgi:hypothetical protein